MNNQEKRRGVVAPSPNIIKRDIEKGKEYINISTNNGINKIEEIIQSNERLSPSIEYAKDSFFCADSVNKVHSLLLKTRLRTLIKNKCMKESDFYKSIGISRNYWYLISYGKQNAPLDLKIKIARALGTDSALIWEGIK